MAAGTILQELHAIHASYALPIAIRCRFDTSGEAPSTLVVRCTSALAPSYIPLTQDLDEQPHEGHRSMFHHCRRTVSTVSCRGQEGIPDTHGVRPQQVETGQLLQRPVAVEDRWPGGA